MKWLQVLVPILLVCFILIASLSIYLRRAHQNACREFAQKYPGALPLRIAPANFFGFSSRGRTQIRGNGSLFLTERNLFFKLFVPNRWFEVPLCEITKIENLRLFLGKTKARKLLAVSFRSRDCKDDAAAWLVADLEAWTKDVERISQNAQAHKRPL